MPQTLPERPPEPPEQRDGGEEQENGRRILLPLGSRISLYYIFVVLILLIAGPLVALLYPDSGLLEAIRAGEAEMDIAFQLWIEAMLAPIVIVMTALFVRFVDKQPLWAIGALWPPGRGSTAARDLLAVALAAATLLTTWYFLASLVVTFDVGVGVEAAQGAPVADSLGHLVLLALGFFAASCLEEWILRGYIYSALRARFSWVHSAGITALIFVLPNLANPDFVAPGLVSAFLIGLLLAAIRELTGVLWTCVVFHGSWNFLTGSIFSLPVSSHAVPGLRPVTVSGPELVSGGDYGPEGSWLMVVLLILAVMAVAWVLTRGEEPEAVEDEDTVQ